MGSMRPPSAPPLAPSWSTCAASRCRSGRWPSASATADPAVPIHTADPQNPFGRLARYGLQAEVPPVAQPPEGAVVRNLLTLWSRLQQAR